ncbi:uncharacterized protein BX664DRAFT_365357 [Halteromyces radiatus]|uniref:uncharacterized protein n=1 Tax=Halteromyces radiatus TaxID=101107 RepID=UPI00221F4B3B|nr:uncharacterized protein BX664DRAFT_365357 [Halteromyces radiatus]KAI8089154.1 hypothetical protein BX664DRAFT_365357 [Halteromyces radiatus]
MAIAAGIHDVRVVYGYLRAPKDSIDTASMNPNKNDNDDDVTLVQNHAWCCVKVEGEYRFVDCWLASPFQPQNKNMMESHWFLTKPSDMIYTHFPQEPEDQCLEPVIHVSTFFALPYVWAPFFSHHLKMIRYDPAMLTLMDDQVCHLTFRVDPQVICFAFVETSEEEEQQKSITIRCLAQCRMIPGENGELERVYKIKAVLPPGHNQGWLKIYAVISESLPPLALCFPLTAKQTQPQLDRSFEFVQLHPCRYEFYIQEPQCYSLYPLQTYNFLVRGAADDLHHKLAIRSPSGKLYKLMYYPQERSYDGSVKIVETGKWCLICLLHHASGWYVVATWECHG